MAVSYRFINELEVAIKDKLEYFSNLGKSSMEEANHLRHFIKNLRVYSRTGCAEKAFVNFS